MPKIEERKMLIKKVHGKNGHFGEMRILAEINRIESFKTFVKGCEKC
jgi:hypothetical protein